MPLPKTLHADAKYGDEIRDDAGELAVTVSGGPDIDYTREFRNEIVHRWNAYQTLRDTLATLHKLVEENT